MLRNHLFFKFRSIRYAFYKSVISAYSKSFVSFYHFNSPFCNSVLSSLKKKKQLNLPFYTVITDFILHPAYVRPEIDGYFTVDNNVFDFAKHHNVSEELFFLLVFQLELIWL
ncbi:hypothetical protein [Bacillus sp. JCM 19034]|uniref:MGDG synthase family glycosyltransferase n=1 Tax=Bacillus sp. JCM 19034 TaxID=1481928 RepID=UPI000781CA4E